MNKFVIIITVVSIALVVGIIALVESSNVSPEKKAEVLTTATEDHAYGNKEAKVTIVEYLDFQCPACAANFPMVEKIKEEYKDKIQFVVRHYPLPSHQYGRAASQAVVAADKQGKFWEMYKLMFDNQETWSNNPNYASDFESYAQQLSLDMDKFRVDRDSQDTKDRIQRDLNSARTLGVQGTPTFFMNGKNLPTPSNVEQFRSLIEQELNK